MVVGVEDECGGVGFERAVVWVRCVRGFCGVVVVVVSSGSGVVWLDLWFLRSLSEVVWLDLWFLRSLSEVV